MKTRTIIFTVGLTVGFFSADVRAQSAEELAEELAAIRADVETLSESLARLKSETKDEIRGLSRQKSDLQIELDREDVRIAKLKSTLAGKRERRIAMASDGKDLGPTIEAALVSARLYIQSSLPFRKADRLAEIDKIERQVQGEVLSNPRALSRLWGFMEDEFRMTKESAAFQQTIEFRGSEQLVDVVRVGMVMMFIATRDGAYGVSQNVDGAWSFVEASDRDAERAIASLFASFKKQIRVGFFTLPNALPKGGQR